MAEGRILTSVGIHDIQGQLHEATNQRRSWCKRGIGDSINNVGSTELVALVTYEGLLLLLRCKTAHCAVQNALLPRLLAWILCATQREL